MSKVKGLSFDEWLRKVNDLCAAKHGLDVDDLADWSSYDAWADGFSPAAGLKLAVASQ